MKNCKKFWNITEPNLDDSGEPDEAPEFEGIVTIPTPEEEKQALEDWRKKVASWDARRRNEK